MRCAVVTGGSRGIGRACVLKLAEAGAPTTFSWVSDAAAAEATVAAAEGQAKAVRAEASSEADTVALFDAAEEFGGPVDAVVVNAGVVAPAGRFVDLDIDRMRRMVEINVIGAFLTAREAARRLSKDGGGRGGSIVLVSSIAARLGGAGEWVDYAATKGAIDSLTVGLARELAGEGVRVNAVRPGLIDTDIHVSGGQPDRVERMAPTVPMRRAGSAQETAEAILWLLSPKASYVTGAILDVGGGR